MDAMANTVPNAEQRFWSSMIYFRRESLDMSYADPNPEKKSASFSRIRIQGQPIQIRSFLKIR